jgi:hypothetical protein
MRTLRRSFFFTPKIMEKYTIYFRDIDPDAEELDKTVEIATTETKKSADWIVQALNCLEWSDKGGNDPLRDYYCEQDLPF